MPLGVTQCQGRIPRRPRYVARVANLDRPERITHAPRQAAGVERPVMVIHVVFPVAIRAPGEIAGKLLAVGHGEQDVV